MISTRRRSARSSAESRGEQSVNYQFLKQQLESILPGWNYRMPPIEKCEREGLWELRIWQLLMCGSNFIKRRCQWNLSPLPNDGWWLGSFLSVKGAYYNLNYCTDLRTSSPQAHQQFLATCSCIVVSHVHWTLGGVLHTRVCQRHMDADYIQDKHMCQRCFKRCQVAINQDVKPRSSQVLSIQHPRNTLRIREVFVLFFSFNLFYFWLILSLTAITLTVSFT